MLFELTALQFEIFIIAILVWDGLFSALFFHWVIRLGIKDISKKANRIYTVAFFVIYSGLRFLILFLDTPYREGHMLLMAFTVLRAVSTAGQVLAFTLLIFAIVRLIARKVKTLPDSPPHQHPPK